MAKNHMKRITAPKTWRVSRKDTNFITRPHPGGHQQALSISLNTFLKEMTPTTQTTKETKYLLTKQDVLVNGTKKRAHKHQVGIMDTITIPSQNKNFRITVDTKGKLTATETTLEDAKQTIAKITGKKILKGKKVQINTLGGINIETDEKQAKEYKTGDTLIISLPEKKIQSHIKRENGTHVLVFTGKHAGKTGTLEEIKEGHAKIKTQKETIQTNKAYVIATGKTKPEVKIE